MVEGAGGGCDVIFNITEGGLELIFLFWRGVLSKFLLDNSSFSATPPDNYCTVPNQSLSVCGCRFISRAAKTENPVPLSVFAPKPNACYAGCERSILCQLRLKYQKFGRRRLY